MKRRYEKTAFVIIVLIAIFFRFWQLDIIPPGFYPDEAMNGNNALEALDTGQFKIFYPENNGREGLFINIQAISVAIFGNSAWSLRVVSAFFGTLAVIGLYLLVKRMMGFEIAAIASFLLATSFWHVLFSRIGFRAIMAPLLLCWGLYFLWRAMSNLKKSDFIISGIIWGLGFYTYIAFRIMPLVVVSAFLAFWTVIKTEYNHERYVHTRTMIAKGLGVMLAAGILTVMPLIWHMTAHPEDFIGRLGQVSVFADPNPVYATLKNIVLTIGMFNFIGDFNWRHNMAGQAQLMWLVGAFFAVGFFRSFYKIYKIKKHHGHLTTVHITLLSWFFLSLLPVVLSNEGMPHALRAIMVIPVACVFAAEGLWWFFTALESYFRTALPHHSEIRMPDYHRIHIKESTLVQLSAILAILAFVGFYEYDKYFYGWGTNPMVGNYFDARSTQIAEDLNAMPDSKKKYVVVNKGGVLVRDVPMPAQPIMYLTDTWSEEKQSEKNIFYITEDDYNAGRFDDDSYIVPIEPFNK